MKPLLTLKLYDAHNDTVTKLETDKVSDLWRALKEVDFVGGTIRADYTDGMYNEASFKNDREAKLLLTLFREKSLLAYLYTGGLV